MSMDRFPPSRQPAFNAPPVLIGLIAALVVCYGLQTAIAFLQIWPLGQMLLWFAFIPSRYGMGAEGLEHQFPGEPITDIISLVTYAFMHGSLVHLLMNSVMLLAAGAPVARLMSGAKFLVFALVCSVAGACSYYFFHQGELVPVIGASAAVSGMLGAVGRVMFAPVQGLMHKGELVAVRRVGLAPLEDRRLIAFALVWTAINLLGGIGAADAVAGGAAIAWEAHIGGFFAGMFLVAFFVPGHGPNQAGPPENHA